ncbi:pinensin family lanthipeptide [Fulvivirga imtechensis]|uniref:pinensin family lanthipeptide n=1 Tax=Fulvivirga imtechensis TaxID=881893 RepID=UPI001C886010
MKKNKLTLNDLSVKSFVTSFEPGSNDTIKGGARSLNLCTASGVCVCRTEDCETQVACDLTNTCPPIKTQPL